MCQIKFSYQTMHYESFKIKTENLGESEANFLRRTFQQKGSEKEAEVITL